MKSQNDQILAHLKRRSITAQEAYVRFGCFRLAARIHDLRSMGHVIDSRIERHPGGRHARYFLKAKRSS